MGDTSSRFSGIAQSTVAFLVTIPYKQPPRILPTGMVVSAVSHFSIFNPKSGVGLVTGISAIYGYDNITLTVTIAVNAPTTVLGDNIQFYANNAAAQIIFTGTRL